MSNIRDFIYYDRSKVLSIGSQLLEGIAETIQTKDVKNQENKKITDYKGDLAGQVGLNTDSTTIISNLINKLATAEASVSTGINKSISKSSYSENNIFENKVVDHFQFTLLRKSLIEQKLLNDLDQIKPHEWESRKVIRKIKPGDFFELTCRSRIYDVMHLESMARSIEAIMSLLQQMMISEEVKKEPGKLNELMDRINNDPMMYGYQIMDKMLEGSVAPLEFNAILELIKDISGGGLAFVPTQLISRPKLGPKNGLKFIAPLRNQYLIDSKEELIFKYGYEPEQDWKVLGQICEIPKERKNNETKFGELNIQKDSKIDDMIQSITDMFMGISSTMGMNSVVKYPNISINLIAVYR